MHVRQTMFWVDLSSQWLIGDFPTRNSRYQYLASGARNSDCWLRPDMCDHPNKRFNKHRQSWIMSHESWYHPVHQTNCSAKGSVVYKTSWPPPSNSEHQTGASHRTPSKPLQPPHSKPTEATGHWLARKGPHSKIQEHRPASEWTLALGSISKKTGRLHIVAQVIEHFRNLPRSFTKTADLASLAKPWSFVIEPLQEWLLTSWGFMMFISPPSPYFSRRNCWIFCPTRRPPMGQAETPAWSAVPSACSRQLPARNFARLEWVWVKFCSEKR